MKILMVCMGNICRSPMMEGWLADAVAREPRLAGRVQVDSAAIGPWHVGNPPDPRAIATAARHGIDIATQRARQLRPEDFAGFDLLLFADAETLRDGRAFASGRGEAASDRYLAHGQASTVRPTSPTLTTATTPVSKPSGSAWSKAVKA